MKIKLFNIIISTLLSSCLLSGQVFANSVVTPATEPATEAVSYTPFLVEGNLTVDDNVTSADNKEFYTVHSKNGNEFFIVVDKANDSNNVYFLNAVDEQDLLSLVDEYQNIYITTEATTMVTTETHTEATSISELETETNNKSKEGSIIPIFIIGGIIGGVIGCFKLKKKNNHDDDPDDSEDSYNKEVTDNDLNNSDEDDSGEVNYSVDLNEKKSVFDDDSENLSGFNSETNSQYESVELPDDEDYDNENSNEENI